ncbi:T6SS immunity protein Tdi1 domain-containing protein [Flavobacterium suncheonense]
MEADECYTFVPALALGGDEKITNLQKVKIKENLEILAQLHN